MFPLPCEMPSHSVNTNAVPGWWLNAAFDVQHYRNVQWNGTCQHWFGLPVCLIDGLPPDALTLVRDEYRLTGHRARIRLL